MLQTLANAFRTPEIRKKIGFAAAMLSDLPRRFVHSVAGCRRRRAQEFQNQFNAGNILGFLNLFSGGSLSRLSLFALGIMPYITASIILQLMTVVSPNLEAARSRR